MARKPKKKIKVLFTIPNFDTAGSGKALLKIAQLLNKDVFQPEILCAHNKGDFFKIVEESGIPTHVFEYTTQMKPYLNGIKKCYQISKKIKTIAPDIIHSFHYAPDYSEPLAAKMAGIKWIYTKKNMNWGGKSKNGWRVRSFLASKIIIQNTDMKELFFKNNNKTFLIPRGVDIKEFFPNKSSIQEFDKETRIIVSVANLVPVKGIEILIQSFAKIENKKNWKLLIVGEDKNDYGLMLKSVVNKLNLCDNIVFVGKVLNVKDYLNLAEIFVLPTLNKGRKEGSPVSLLEAMACGLNVLGSNISGIKDQLSLFPNHRFEAGNVNDLMCKLENLMKNSTAKNKEKGLQLKDFVYQNYTIDQEVFKTENLYNIIMNNTN